MIYIIDFLNRYKPNGTLIINQFINFEFKNINFLNNYFIPELITGILIKIFLTNYHFL